HTCIESKKMNSKEKEIFINNQTTLANHNVETFYKYYNDDQGEVELQKFTKDQMNRFEKMIGDGEDEDEENDEEDEDGEDDEDDEDDEDEDGDEDDKAEDDYENERRKINRVRWNNDEDKILKNGIKQFGEGNWTKIYNSCRSKLKKKR